MKKVISLALFGDGTRYAAYTPAFVRAHLTLFPQAEGWELRVHHDDHLDSTEGGRLLRALAARGLVRLVAMGEAPLTRAMLWRMTPVWDPEVDYVFARDIDALPTPRDRACCDRFIESGCDVHTVHDSRSHDGIMGGLSGYQAETFRQITGFTSPAEMVAFGDGVNDGQWARHGFDQEVLNRLVHVDHRGAGLALFEHRYAGWAAGAPGPDIGRKPSARACVSEPVPDYGTHNVLRESDGYLDIVHHVKTEVLARADALVAHLGAAGFDVDQAVVFYDLHGEPSVMQTVRECEPVQPSVIPASPEEADRVRELVIADLADLVLTAPDPRPTGIGPIRLRPVPHTITLGQDDDKQGVIVAPGGECSATCTPCVLFRADRAEPVDGIDYEAFEVLDAHVGPSPQIRNPRPMLEVFKKLRLPSDYREDDSDVQKQTGRFNTCAIGHDITLRVRNVSDRPERFAVQLVGSMLPNS